MDTAEVSFIRYNPSYQWFEGNVVFRNPATPATSLTFACTLNAPMDATVSEVTRGLEARGRLALQQLEASHQRNTLLRVGGNTNILPRHSAQVMAFVKPAEAEPTHSAAA